MRFVRSDVNQCKEYHFVCCTEYKNNLNGQKNKVEEFPLTGSLAVGTGKGIVNAIGLKATDLNIPSDEAMEW